MEAPLRAEHAPAAPDDADLMLAYAAGDASAFDTLYARHKGGMYRYLLRHCGNAGTADELFQDVWMRVIRGRTSYVPSAQFATWLYTIAHHRLVDHWRAISVAPQNTATDGEDVLDQLPSEAEDDPTARIAARELRERLRAAIAALPFAQRDAFLLHHEGGLDLAHIAELTGTGVETVKSRLRYATARLRQRMGELR